LALINLIADFILVPVYGIHGAAIAATLTQLAITLIYWKNFVTNWSVT